MMYPPSVYLSKIYIFLFKIPWTRGNDKFFIRANCLTVYFTSFCKIKWIFAMLSLVVTIARRPWRAASTICSLPVLKIATYLQTYLWNIWQFPKISKTSLWISTGLIPNKDLAFILALNRVHCLLFSQSFWI